VHPLLGVLAAAFAFVPPTQSLPSSAPSLNDRIANVIPTGAEEKWANAGWRTNLMAARLEAQKAKKPIFLWIMVGNPQGCT
jgi:hypothetical protein